MCTDRHDHTSTATPLRPFRIGTGQPQLVLPDKPSWPAHRAGVDGDDGEVSPGDPTA